MLDQFKNFNTEGLELDELLALSAFGRAMRTECEAQKVSEPEYVAEQLNTLRREIEARMSDRREARKREIKAQLESLKTKEEKRAALEQELAALEQTIVP
jgi:ATP-dependent Lon protease